MGKHSARDGATAHPLVVEALQRRQLGTSVPGGAPRSSEVGWPASPGRGEGLGWPGDLPAEPLADTAGPVAHTTGPVDRAPEDDGSVLAVLDEAAAQEAEDQAQVEAEVPGGQPVRRQGWRRFFGGGGSAGRSTSAA